VWDQKNGTWGGCEFLIALGQRRDGRYITKRGVPYHGVDGVKACLDLSVDHQSTSRANVVGVIIPTARLLDGIKGPDTTPGLLGTAFLCPNVRTPFPPRALPSRRRRAGGLSRYISHWRCDAEWPEWGDSATIYPGCLSETSLNGLPVCLSDLDLAFADR